MQKKKAAAKETEEGVWVCYGMVCMQSSNVMEDISCRTADLEELIYPWQTEIKLFVRKDIIDILRGEHKTDCLSFSPRNRFTRYSNESIYRLLFFSKINFVSSLFLFLRPFSIFHNVISFAVVAGRPTFLAYLFDPILDIKKIISLLPSPFSELPSWWSPDPSALSEFLFGRIRSRLDWCEIHHGIRH